MGKPSSIAVVALVCALVFAWTASAATRTVKVRDNSYSKSSANIKQGASLTFDWDRAKNRHNVTVDSGPSDFQSKTRRGSAYSYTKKFMRRGTYKLICTIHPDEMRITVKVTRR